MDNYATHKTAAVKAWLARRWHVHFTPTSASWINQVERWFAELCSAACTAPRQLEADISTSTTKTPCRRHAAVKRFCLRVDKTYATNFRFR